MKKKVNEIYLLISVAVFMILAVDTILGFHPAGNLAGVVLLLLACYKIGKK